MMDHEEYLRRKVRSVVDGMKRAGDDAYRSYTKKINSLKSFGKNVDWVLRKLNELGKKNEADKEGN
jgi:histidinol dehydrogenase